MYIFGLNEALWQLLKLTLHEMPLHYMAFFEGIFDLKPSGRWSSLHYMRLWQLLKLTLHEMPLHYMAFFEGIFDLKLSGSCSSLHYMRLLYTTWVFRMYIFGLNEGLWQLLKLTLHEMPLHYMAFFEGIFDLKPSGNCSSLPSALLWNI